jgi:hypothetical protein
MVSFKLRRGTLFLVQLRSNTVNTGDAKCVSANVAPCRVSSGWENLKRLEELDDAVPIVRRQPVERLTRGQTFARVRLDRLAHGCELAVVHVRTGIADTPELAGNEFRIPGKEGGRAYRAILIEGLGIRIARTRGNVM